MQDRCHMSTPVPHGFPADTEEDAQCGLRWHSYPRPDWEGCGRCMHSREWIWRCLSKTKQNKKDPWIHNAALWSKSTVSSRVAKVPRGLISLRFLGEPGDTVEGGDTNWLVEPLQLLLWGFSCNSRSGHSGTAWWKLQWWVSHGGDAGCEAQGIQYPAWGCPWEAPLGHLSETH